jgi:ferric-dicitrate binding protein FerR (iron transport regulator)
MPDSFDWRIIDRHLAGDTTPEDESALRAWLASDPRNAELLNAARLASRGVDRPNREAWDADRAWARVAARMTDASDGDVIPLHARGTGVIRSPVAARAQRVVAGAAVAIVAAGVVAVVLQHGAIQSVARGTSQLHEVAAAVAQQTRVTLGDGTRVVLNSGSRLRYADDFGRAARDVDLDGEAFFDVTHDESRPFRVHARGSVAEDLGTSFVVRAYPEQRTVDVVVTHGAVSLRREGASTAPALLAAGQRGQVHPTGAVTVVAEADVDRWTAWTRGGIVLDGMMLSDAAVELERRFGVHVEIRGDDLARRHVSARFHDESLPHVLDALALAVGARWTRDGDRVVVAPAE